MNAIEISIEFNKEEGFSRILFENTIRKELRNKSLKIENFWCIQEKKVMLEDYPVLFVINECILEIVISEQEQPDTVFIEVKDFLYNLSSKQENYFQIISINYRFVSIKDDQSSRLQKEIILVTGAGGQLGHDMMNCLFMHGYQAIGSGLSATYSGIQDSSPVTKMPYISMNIMDSENVKKILREIKPSVVIHCAAYNLVDRAEEEYAGRIADSTNYYGSLALAEACAEIDAKMVYISTDYVFDGKGDLPWDADTRSFGALNVYGQTKLKGEIAVSDILDKYFILRTSWAYGINGNNFVKAMLNVDKKNRSINVVNDQIGTPTYMKDLAELIVSMIDTDKYGFYNVTNGGGYISWYEFACEIYRQAGMDVNVRPVSSENYMGNKAQRPKNSRLDNKKLVENGFIPLPDWKDALRRYLIEISINSV